MPLVTDYRRARHNNAPLQPLPQVGDMVIFDNGGHLHEAWFVGVCIAVDPDQGECQVHYYNRHNRHSDIRRQEWHPAWKLQAGRGPEVFEERPPMGSRPVITNLRRSEIIVPSFQLTPKGRRIPARVLRLIHDSPATEWRLPGA